MLGVCKTYTTRVGSGPFPTELTDEIGDSIREKGKEYGTTTGRGRRIGWLDLVALRHSARLNSLSGLIVTRLDTLSDYGTLKLCVGYRLDGETIDWLPGDADVLSRLEPIYEELPGWTGDLRGARSLDDLPAEAKAYLDRMSEFTGVPVAILSVGPDRAETIVARPDLVWVD